MATATLLPPARSVFYDANGAPLSGGFVYTYVPGGSTPKTTWQNANESTPNQNPVPLDANGSCLLYGSGQYQLTVTDALGNQVPAYSGLSQDTITQVVSPAMLPVVQASTTAIAFALLGGSPGYATIGALRSSDIASPSLYCYVAGYSAQADGGEGVFVFAPSDHSSADNGGTIIVDAASNRWYRDTGSGAWSIRWFGAKIDGTTDDTTAWDNTLTAGRLAGNPRIFHPGGNSIYTGNLALIADTIVGVGSYSAPPGGVVTQDSLITFHGNNSGLTLVDATSGSFTLEKIGFAGIPGTYTGQVGLLMSDTLRPGGQNEGWPTLRDVLFTGFSTGMLVGNTYQTGFMFNVFFYNSVVIGYQNQSTDWYHHGVYGGGAVVASTAQLVVGTIAAGLPAGATGNHQFVGGAWFNGTQAAIVQNSVGNAFTSVWFQLGAQNGVLLGNNTTGSGLNVFNGCFFNANNQSGGNRNVNGHSYYDICFTGGSRNNRVIGCVFDTEGAATAAPCVAASIFIPTNCTGTVIDGCSFNMDMIVPAAGGAPTTPIAFDSFSLNAALDQTMIAPTNIMVFGEDGVYTPFNLLPVTMALVCEPFTVNANLSIQAGTAVLSAASGTIACTLADPGYAGRHMFVTEKTAATGDTVVAHTSGAFGGGHTTATFTAVGAYMSILSTSATQWQLMSSTSVTFS